MLIYVLLKSMELLKIDMYELKCRKEIFIESLL